MNSNQLPLSGGVAIFFAVIVSYFVLDPTALEGFRPIGDNRNIKQVHGMEDVQARLWQDPFAAAALHSSSQEKGPGQIRLSGKAIITPLREKESPGFELTLQPSKLTSGKQTEETERHSFRKLIEEIKKEAAEEAKWKNSEGITVLAVMVSAGPYAKQAETRLRTRYAVLSGLGSAEFYPKNSGHIGYVNDLNDFKRIKKMSKDFPDFNGEEDQLPFVMPYEWYESKNDMGEKHILLLWLDEDAFSSKPLTKLNLIFDSLENHVTKIKLIGPYGSTVLKAMMGEAEKYKDKLDTYFSTLKKVVDVYSATATAVASALIVEKKIGNNAEKVKNIVDPEGKLHDLLGSKLTRNKGNKNGVFRSFNRTIADDGKLTRMIVKELKMRMEPQEAEGLNFDVAIVSEWDTAYGRALPDAFAVAACQQWKNKDKCDKQKLKKYEEELEDYKKEHLHLFKYMRGIDGTLAARDDSNQSKSQEVDASEGGNRTIIVERPEGRSQKDYLRRLADQISIMDKKLKFKGKKGIRAIGVLGSDVYDKLLILRVLRERFPKAVFFTTDLDAAFLHPDQFRWTRNMVVASAFDLTLADGQQENGPSFRDSYQTSIYYSIKMAIKDKNEKSSAAVYEIGRSGFFLLHYPNSELISEDAMSWDHFAGVIQANEINLKPISKYFMVLMFIVFLAVSFWRTRIMRRNKRKKRKKGWVITVFRWFGLLVVRGCIFLLVLQLIILTWGSTGVVEGFYGVQSLNLTTTVTAIFYSIILYLYFYLLVWRVQRPWREISVKLLGRKNRRYRNSDIRFKAIKKALYSFILIIRAFFAFFLRPFIYAKPVHFAVLILGAFCFDLYDGRYEPIYLTEGISIWPTEFLRLVAVWLSFFLMWRGWSHMKKNRAEIGQGLGLSSFGCYLPTKSTDIRYIWIWYKREGTCWQRIKRIFWPAMIWLTICVMIFGIQSPNIPFRGEAAYWTDLAVSALAIFSVIMLFVFIVDSTLHCRYFIQKLIQHDTWWPFMEKPKDGVSGFEHQMVCDIKREWKETRIIAMLSDDISRMVYYPIYVILLLLAAQSDYFDNWDMPYPLVLVATVNVGISLYFAIMLRRSAVKARDVSLEKIHHIESEVLAIRDDDLRERILRKLNFYKEQIESIRKGAFLPISEQPWLRALTLMFGGGSSLLLLQYMSG